MRSEQRLRQDFKAFKALIATPGNLVTGFKLPGNGEIYISTTSVTGAATNLVTYGARTLGVPAGAAGRTQHVGWCEKSRRVVKAGGAPGTVRMYVSNGMGKLLKIGEG